MRPHYKTLGIDLAVLNGDDSFELPLPATYAIARDGTVLNAWVDADYRKRPEPETILRWLDPAARAA